MRNLNSHYEEAETQKKNEVSPHKAKTVSEINNTCMLTSALYTFCWLKSWGGGKVDLKAILLWRREEVKISTSDRNMPLFPVETSSFRNRALMVTARKV